MQTKLHCVTEKDPLRETSHYKRTEEINKVASPTSQPNVQGAFGMYPTPKALATASARRGFSSRAPGAGAASIFAVIPFFQIKDNGVAAALDDFFFIENRIGDDVLFAGPIAQVALPAALAAKGT